MTKHLNIFMVNGIMWGKNSYRNYFVCTFVSQKSEMIKVDINP